MAVSAGEAVRLHEVGDGAHCGRQPLVVVRLPRRDLLDKELLQLEAALVGAEHGDGHVGRGKVDDGGLFLAHAGTAGEDDVQRVGTSSRMNSGEEGTIGVSK